MFTPDHEATAQELARVVKPGGRIALANWTPEGGLGTTVRDDGALPAPSAARGGKPVRVGREEHVQELLGEAFELTSNSTSPTCALRPARRTGSSSPRATGRRRRWSTRSTTSGARSSTAPGSSSSRRTTATTARSTTTASTCSCWAPGASGGASAPRRGDRAPPASSSASTRSTRRGTRRRAAELLRDYLEEAGRRVRALRARRPTRANLVARIPGRGDGQRLLLLAHTDTVLADPAEWSVDPWSGELRDGHVWGRGALDMKGQVAASAVAIASLAREGFRAGGRPDLRRHGRRGGRRGLRPLVALPRAPGRGPRRVLRQRGRRRPRRRERAAGLPLRRRREDELAVPSSASAAAAATRRCPGSRTTRSSRRRG